MLDAARPTSSDPVVRRLSHDDLEHALALSSTAGWNQRIHDWRMLLALAPAGSFAAVCGDRIVGTAIAIDYGDFSWVAMMLVDPAYRGRGLGRRLLEAALESVPAATPVRLDATPMGRPLYRAYGFQDEATITRSVADVSSGQPRLAPGDPTVDVRPLTAADLSGVAEYDRCVFAGNRRPVLEWALDIAPEYAQIVESGRRQAGLQYCFGRCGRLFDQIGPVVAGSDDAAIALAGAALRATRRRSVVVDAFDDPGRFPAWLRACGFQAQRSLFRMRRPPQPSAHHEQPPEVTTSREYAILGPEFA